MQILFKFFDPTSECFAKYDAFCLHVFDVRAEGVRFITVEEIRNYGKLYTSKTFLKMAGGKDVYPSSYAPGHKLQKPSKESGTF